MSQQLETLFHFIAIQAIFLLLVGCSNHRIKDPSMTQNQKAHTHLDKLISEGEYPGIQYTVLDKDGVVFEYNGGHSDTQTQSPVTAETAFMSASMTKVITALAVLKLVDQSLVSLDEPVNTYFRKHPYGKDLTVRQLISHTAGVPNPMPLDWFHRVENHENYNEDAELQRRLNKSHKLKSEPGADYRYTNMGYWLLYKVVENSSGMSYENYVQKNIIAPLGISNEDLGFTIPDPEHRAVGYIKRWSFMRALMGMMTPGFVIGESAGAWTSFEPLYMNGPAYGGLFGNARGWSKFLADQLADNSKVMSAGVRKLFYEKQRTNDGEEINMTLGWHTGAVDGHKYYYKAGGGPGYACNIRIYPDEGIATVWLSNKMEASESPIQALSDAIDFYFINSHNEG